MRSNAILKLARFKNVAFLYLIGLNTLVIIELIKKDYQNSLIAFISTTSIFSLGILVLYIRDHFLFKSSKMNEVLNHVKHEQADLDDEECRKLAEQIVVEEHKGGKSAVIIAILLWLAALSLFAILAFTL